MAADWLSVLQVDGFETRPGVGFNALREASQALGKDLPDDLASLYAESDGVFAVDGQWWVIWPLDMLTADNVARWASGLLPPHFLAFGDDGTGDAFCLEGSGPDVTCWHAVGGNSVHLSSNLYDFCWGGRPAHSLLERPHLGRTERTAAGPGERSCPQRGR